MGIETGKGGERGESEAEALPSETRRLAAAEGLALVRGPSHAAIEWGETDWFGPVGWARDPQNPEDARELAAHEPLTRREGSDDLGAYETWEFPAGAEGADAFGESIRASVRAYRDHSMLVFRSEARAALDGFATGKFNRPSFVWPWLRPAQRVPGGVAEGTRAFGYQYTEFALPTFSDASCARFFLLSPFRPEVVQPLALVAPDGRCLLLAPLDSFHEQIIAVPAGPQAEAEGLRCGWHGDLARVPEGFASELALIAAPGLRRALERWGALLQRRAGTRRLSRYADDAVGRLSYWTDNGAAYWYRCEPGKGIEETLRGVAEGLQRDDVPVAAYEIDSWFYPHEFTRRFDAPPNEVPPSGCMRWEPREDALPDGMASLRRSLGEPPLVLHARHYSSRSPYFERFPAWVDGDRAHPKGDELFAHFCEQAAGWGAIQIEQDWMVESFLGVRGLREEPGRAAAWQRGMDASAAEHGLNLVWCMSTPADFCESVSLGRVAAIRTSGDYRYRIGNASLWCWFLYGNALARALGLLPFKDVFMSRRDGEGVDGDACAEAEALLSALSAGPVGIGDRVDRTDRSLVMRTCRPDGVLVKPDRPLAALERCFHRHAHNHPDPLLAETTSEHSAGRWIYLVALHAYRGDESLRFRVEFSDLADVAPSGPVVAYDWRSGRFERLSADAGFEEELAPREWSLRVLCPLLRGGFAIFGDVTLYASVGDRRVREISEVERGVDLDVLGMSGESVEIRGYSEGPLEAIRGWAPSGEVAVAWSREESDGAFSARFEVPAAGWLRLEVRAGA